MNDAQFNFWLFGSAFAALMFGRWQHSLEAGLFLFDMIMIVRLMMFDNNNED